MRLTVTILLLLSLAGCAGHYRISKEDYRKTVKTLGLLPLLVDETSTVTHAERQGVIDLLRHASVGRETELVERLKERGDYFDVRPVAGDSRELFSSLVWRSAQRGEGNEVYRHYDFNAQAVAALAEKNRVDALLVVVLNGVERPEKRWDRLHVSFLEADYNTIQATAAVVLPSGEIVWELPGMTFLELQYPDFDEARFNRTEQVRIKQITLAGLERALAEVERGVFGRRSFPRHYGELFDRLAEELRPGLRNPFKAREPDTNGAAPARGY
jgi:hypothetical protein